MYRGFYEKIRHILRFLLTPFALAMLCKSSLVMHLERPLPVFLQQFRFTCANNGLSPSQASSKRLSSWNNMAVKGQWVVAWSFND